MVSEQFFSLGNLRQSATTLFAFAISISFARTLNYDSGAWNLEPGIWNLESGIYLFTPAATPSFFRRASGSADERRPVRLRARCWSRGENPARRALSREPRSVRRSPPEGPDPKLRRSGSPGVSSGSGGCAWAPSD